MSVLFPPISLSSLRSWRTWERKNASPWIAFLIGCVLVSCPIAHTGATEGRHSDEGVFNSDSDNSPTPDLDDSEDGGVDASLPTLWNLERIGRLVPLSPEPMAAFFEALDSMETDGEGLVRVLHYGDSHTAADFITTAIRRSLQKRFGDGGRGFILLGKPWRSYMPKDVETSARGPWQMHRILIAADPASLDGRYGLGGVAVDASVRAATTRVASIAGSGFGNKMSSVEVFYLEQPRGGSFTVKLDRRSKRTVNTSKKRVGSGFFRLEMDEGMHEVEIQLKGDGKVRLFGAVVENDGPGIVYDTLGINGAFFYTPLRWDAGLLAEQVEQRDPDLIVTMYGANEADSRNLTPAKYALNVKKALARLRAGAPEAACLLLGPTDRRMPVPPGEPSKLDFIIDVQREVADEEGCGFIDLRGLMGGPGSHGLWVTRGLAQPDGIHLTVRGYNALGEMLVRQIFNAYKRHLEENDNPERVDIDGSSN
ncbi:MAG: hypothetical protein GY854_27675 [Deltaproteobacteria bacterium]|nr:hypothetical protein [Deltaproteobacteria bacterium]